MNPFGEATSKWNKYTFIKKKKKKIEEEEEEDKMNKLNQNKISIFVKNKPPRLSQKKKVIIHMQDEPMCRSYI